MREICLFVPFVIKAFMRRVETVSLKIGLSHLGSGFDHSRIGL
jgi:hypothetical protein